MLLGMIAASSIYSQLTDLPRIAAAVVAARRKKFQSGEEFQGRLKKSKRSKKRKSKKKSKKRSKKIK